MRLALVSVALLAPLAHAYAGHHARQAPPASSSSSTAGTTPPPSPSPPPPSQPPPPPPQGTTSSPGSQPPPSQPPPPPPPSAPPAAGSSVPGQPTPLPPPATTFSFSLQSTNPTAVPLSDIVSTAATLATIPLGSTASPGAIPSSIPKAAPLPNAALLNPTSYPALDKIPPVDSPEVQQWINDVRNALGGSLPTLSATLPGGCPANLQAAQDPSRCWWTCSGCTRSTDIATCPQKNTWGLTYDDGPAFYTPQLLNYLDEQKLKSTFYVVGSRCISFPQILQEQYMSGHQIAVHTWSHPSLTTLTNEEIIAELGWSKKVIKDILGVTPNMMRPPFGDIDDRVRNISLAMGLRPVMWTRINQTMTFDTDDFNIHSGVTPVSKVLQNWQNIMTNVTSRSDGFIVLEHDLFQQTVEVATGYILPDALARKLTIQPVITCQQQPLANAYIETNDNNSNPPPSSPGAASIPGSPGATNSGLPAPGGSGSSDSSAIATFGLGAAGTALVTTLFAGLAAGLSTAL